MPKGLSAIVLPDLGQRFEGQLEKPGKESVVIERLNTFLAQLNALGLDIVSVMEVKVNIGQIPGIFNDVIEIKKIAIIRRS